MVEGLIERIEREAETPSLLDVLSERLAERLGTSAFVGERARSPVRGSGYGTVLGPSSRAACPAPSAFGVVELIGRSA